MSVLTTCMIIKDQLVEDDLFVMFTTKCQIAKDVLIKVSLKDEGNFQIIYRKITSRHNILVFILAK